jgi:7,8-dihydropterin-6-yl-methyl-4-(beta-D-ribofuranosyl)aminobenzene 5'-phosphate synthase
MSFPISRWNACFACAMKLAIVYRSFLFFVIGVSLCACSVTWSGERTQVLPTQLPSTRTDAPSTTAQTSTPFSITSQTPEERKAPTMKAPVDVLRITIVYDNNPFDPRLKTAWGFSALVEYREQTLLFDTGGDGRILLENMRVLGIDPARIQSVILSHAHGDHTGGLSALLDIGNNRPSVYLLPSFADTYKRQVGQVAQVIEAAPGQVVGNGILTTGEISGNIPEQALLIRTNEGLVVITGCAHPGIVRIIERAKELTGDPVHLVLGGFHLDNKSETEISAILADFRRLGVQKVAPCHCTGERAIAMFTDEYGQTFVQAGVGMVINFDRGGIDHEDSDY